MFASWNDLMFDESYCEQGRNFANKVWNAFRLINGFEVGNSEQPQSSKAAITWFENKLSEQLEIINDHYSKHRMSDALMTTYKLVWDDFCAWYLEAIKPDFVDGKALPIDKTTFDTTINFLESLLKIMHPWMPFITEEIWHLLKERTANDCIIVAGWPTHTNSDQLIIANFEFAQEIIVQVRNFRNSNGISPKEKMELIYKGKEEGSDIIFKEIIIKLANLSAYISDIKEDRNGYLFNVKGHEYVIISNTEFNLVDLLEKLNKELEYNKGFLKSVMIKLGNEKFVANAKPEVLAIERKKESDALSKIASIEEQLQSLN